MQRAAERDVHLLKAAADAEQRYAARDAGLDQRQRERVARLVIRLVARIGLRAPKCARMHIGAGAGEQHAVDGVEQRVDIGDLRRAGKISGSAPAVSAAARRLRSPTRCAVNLPSARCALPMTPTTGFFVGTSKS